MSEPVAVQLRRRRAYAHTCRFISCGRCTDPWTCRCWNPDEITDRYVDGYRDAAQHLLDQGLTPAPNVLALRVMWRRGGDDQRLARRVAERWEVAA
ncbi:hypothetical protein [Mycolicibacterium celeriflavum]|uniref:hypothetical protein n=1 Tax=Mycolicibacterium celeriflavum TaxID=1249101 RepID=UPI000A0B57F3|nr:hypothetical protein [Mycolicibacterium celeriflavum]MCV7237706.1 hypothetical protein [Mycolicibacterium celeriflavum]ORA49974.1 hypothetical protein BST21_05445 [Mycolicibacterium celeriflavum]